MIDRLNFRIVSFLFLFFFISAFFFLSNIKTNNELSENSTSKVHFSENLLYNKKIQDFALASIRQKSQPINPCDIYGQIYDEKDRRRAQFLVHVETENEFRSNLVVFKETNVAFADNKGLWYFTNNRGFADYAVHFVEDRSIADFIIYYTDKPHYAGCR